MASAKPPLKQKKAARESRNFVAVHDLPDWLYSAHQLGTGSWRRQEQQLNVYPIITKCSQWQLTIDCTHAKWLATNWQQLSLQLCLHKSTTGESDPSVSLFTTLCLLLMCSLPLLKVSVSVRSEGQLATTAYTTLFRSLYMLETCMYRRAKHFYTLKIQFSLNKAHAFLLLSLASFSAVCCCLLSDCCQPGKK